MGYEPKNYANITYGGTKPSAPTFSAGGYGQKGDYNVSRKYNEGNFSLATALQKGTRLNIKQSAIQQGNLERGNLLSQIGQFLKPALRREKEFGEMGEILKAGGATKEEMKDLGYNPETGEQTWGSWWETIRPKWLAGQTEGSSVVSHKPFRDKLKSTDQSPLTMYSSALYGDE